MEWIIEPGVAEQAIPGCLGSNRGQGWSNLRERGYTGTDIYKYIDR